MGRWHCWAGRGGSRVDDPYSHLWTCQPASRVNFSEEIFIKKFILETNILKISNCCLSTCHLCKLSVYFHITFFYILKKNTMLTFSILILGSMAHIYNDFMLIQTLLLNMSGKFCDTLVIWTHVVLFHDNVTQIKLVCKHVAFPLWHSCHLKICVSLLAFVWAASWTTSLAKARLTLHCTEWNTTDWALLYRFGVNAINDKDWFEKKFLFRASFARLRWWAELPAPLVSYCLVVFCVVVLLCF